MTGNEIMNLDLNAKLTTEEIVKGAFEIYGLNAKDHFIASYLSYFSDFGVDELLDAIMSHLDTEEHDAPVQSIIKAKIMSQRVPEGQSTH